jgi:hypothetical protein
MLRTQHEMVSAIDRGHEDGEPDEYRHTFDVCWATTRGGRIIELEVQPWTGVEGPNGTWLLEHVCADD